VGELVAGESRYEIVVVCSLRRVSRRPLQGRAESVLRGARQGVTGKGRPSSVGAL
jgi:hypothetical protein